MPQPSSPVLHSLRVHPVKSVGGFTADSAFVEPWGLAGDRRWALVDMSDRAVTQREQPRLALARAVSSPDGGIVVRAPGREPLEVARPSGDGSSTDAAGAGVDRPRPALPGDGVVVNLFGTKVDAVLADTRAGDWFSRHLGVEVRLIHLGDPAHARPADPRYARAGETVSLADSNPLLVVSLSSLDALNSLVAQGDHAYEGPLPMNRFRPNLVVAGTAPWAEDAWRRITVGEVTFRVTKPCARCVITTVDQETGRRGKEPLRALARHRRFDGKLLFGQHLTPENTGTVRVGDPVTIVTGTLDTDRS
ncbi:MOSC domain-containing protein [Streptomyces sp. NBC_01498]|uniref:MOSC domain-containing protein n=1 Tax=Streptomyces sp. NBC_01498 TaxID=2975870 RepID=UPI002E7B166B|nr:MOSC domain-containing protein [Streptomyces sp. NBC_01498]WTL28251.1 MOSC domain-containing protein [Streptomyces sp. NBC_01498]